MTSNLKAVFVATVLAASTLHAADRWSVQQASDWQARTPWLSGSNFVPSSAINQLEMWQAETFDATTIDRELGWAEALGFNSMRVFLHHLPYEADPQGFLKRLDDYLAIADKHHIGTMFVFFDSCWDPEPRLGPQHRPIPGVHNSGWVQSPGRKDLLDPSNDAHLRRYVEDVVGTFGKDDRVLLWDLWNEPDIGGGGNLKPEELDQERPRIEQLLPQIFAWARAQRPVQPLSSGLWGGGDWSPSSKALNAVQRTQLAQSDVITFHNYGWPEEFEGRLAQLKPYGRPIVCTAWMARSTGATADAILPIALREDVGMLNWGYVQGATQTYLPWDSWERPYTRQQPVVWFHDLMHPDGRPYRDREAELFRSFAAKKR
jgi:hypothetical protein